MEIYNKILEKAESELLILEEKKKSTLEKRGNLIKKYSSSLNRVETEISKIENKIYKCKSRLDKLKTKVNSKVEDAPISQEVIQEDTKIIPVSVMNESTGEAVVLSEEEMKELESL